MYERHSLWLSESKSKVSELEAESREFSLDSLVGRQWYFGFSSGTYQYEMGLLEI